MSFILATENYYLVFAGLAFLFFSVMHSLTNRFILSFNALHGDKCINNKTNNFVGFTMYLLKTFLSFRSVTLAILREVQTLD